MQIFPYNNFAYCFRQDSSKLEITSQEICMHNISRAKYFIIIWFSLLFTFLSKLDVLLALYPSVVDKGTFGSTHVD